MGFSWIAPVRGVQLFFGLIVMAVAASLIDSANHVYGFVNSPRVDFNVFVGLWTILVCAFFLAITFAMSESFLANPIIALALDGLSWVFWVAAFACIADIFSGVTCDTGSFCGRLDALIAFGVLNWLLFTATLIWNAMTSFRGNKSGGAHQGV